MPPCQKIGQATAIDATTTTVAVRMLVRFNQRFYKEKSFGKFSENDNAYPASEKTHVRRARPFAYPVVGRLLE